MSDKNAKEPGTEPLDRREFLGAAGAVVGGAVLGANALGRMAGAVAYAAGGPSTTPDATGKIASGNPNIPDAYVKLPPAFKSVHNVPGSGSTVSTMQISYYPPITAHDQNAYWLELEKQLNVKYQAIMVPANTYPDKFAVLLASGSLPDIMFMPGLAPDLQACQQGAFTDLTPYLTGTALHDYPNLAAFPPAVWQNSRRAGKIYGVPRPRLPFGSMLQWRVDWQQKAGYATMRNANDYLACMMKVTNAKKDVFALGGYGGWFPDGIFSFQPIRQMFRCVNYWRLNADGSLTYDIETPEFKQALAFARRLVQAGVYNPGSANMAQTQDYSLLYAGKIGGYVDSFNSLPGISNNRMQTEATQPGSFCWGLVPPGWDGGKSHHFMSPGFYGISGIPVSAAKSPDRVKELLRILDYFAAPFGSEEYIFLANGVKGIHYKLDKNGNIVDLPRWAKDIAGGISDLTNLTNSPPVYYFPGSADSLSDGLRMLELSRQVLPLGVQDPTLGMYSPTAISKAGVLTTLNSDQLTGIISGRQPLSALDTWIQDWRNQGGEAMRKELQQAMAAAHKK